MFGFAQPITAQDADVCVHLRLCRMVLRDHVLVTFFLRVLVFPLIFFSKCAPMNGKNALWC